VASAAAGKYGDGFIPGAIYPAFLDAQCARAVERERAREERLADNAARKAARKAEREAEKARWEAIVAARAEARQKGQSTPRAEAMADLKMAALVQGLNERDTSGEAPTAVELDARDRARAALAAEYAEKHAAQTPAWTTPSVWPTPAPLPIRAPTPAEVAEIDAFLDREEAGAAECARIEAEEKTRLDRLLAKWSAETAQRLSTSEQWEFWGEFQEVQALDVADDLRARSMLDCTPIATEVGHG
jgi:hypothetical protein